jgi:hypothetical protein
MALAVVLVLVEVEPQAVELEPVVLEQLTKVMQVVME